MAPKRQFGLLLFALLVPMALSRSGPTYPSTTTEPPTTKSKLTSRVFFIDLNLQPFVPVSPNTILKNHWNPGIWVLIWVLIQWVPTWQGLDGVHCQIQSWKIIETLTYGYSSTTKVALALGGLEQPNYVTFSMAPKAQRSLNSLE